MTEPPMIAFLHFPVGCLCVLAGFAAFMSPKGKTVHRLAGNVFTLAMIALCVTGLWMSLSREILFTVFLALIALHAVFTGWASAHGAGPVAQPITMIAPASSGLVALGASAGAMLAAKAPGGMLNDLPPTVFLVAALAGAFLFVFDLRFAASGLPSGQRRLTRHAWRMGFSMFLATGIFFFGNNHVLPDMLRVTPVLTIPVVLVAAFTIGFSIRARFRKLQHDTGNL